MQAFAAEWGVGRLGVAWSDPEAPPPSTRVVLRRLGTGALLGLGAAALTLGVAGASHAVTFPKSSPAPSEVVLGVVVAALVAVRDELLLRGLVLRAFRHTLSPSMQVLVCGVVATAARLGQEGDAPIGPFVTSPGGLASLAVAGMTGACFATLWLRERGAWRACGAHALWTFATTTGISGGLCDGHWSTSAWGGGASGFEGSLAVMTGLGLVTALAMTSWFRAHARTR